MGESTVGVRIRSVPFAIAAFVVATCAGAVVLQTRGESPALAASGDMCTTRANLPLVLQPKMPATFVFFAGEDQNLGQARADCQAWQQFIYMNWPAFASPSYGIPNPKAPFGTSNVTRTVWVSYNRPVDIFTPHPQALHHSKLVLRFTSEPLGNAIDFPGSEQATGGWIAGRRPVKTTDRKRSYTPLVFYDVWVDRDEQDYTWRNRLQYAAVQNTCAASKGGFQLPKGSNDVDCLGNAATYGLGIGAVEVKAALLDLGPAPLKSDGNLDTVAASKMFPTYFLFPDPVELDYPSDDVAGGTPIGNQPNRLVGLVGLHIIRKVPGAQQFIWSTFEHRDNDPSAGQTPPPNGWTFNSPSSTQAPNANPSPCPSSGCYYGPTQIVRTTAIDPIARAANASFWSLPGLRAGSVFRHYELVQVQWPQQDFPVPPGAGVGPPNYSLVTSFFVPQANVADSVLETFGQPMTCVMCHAGAGVATPNTAARVAAASNGAGGGHVFRVAGKVTGPHPRRRRSLVGEGPPTPIPEPTGPPYASDFSFLFGDHGLPGTPPPAVRHTL